MIAAMNVALSGLQAVGTKVRNNADNIANLNTDGYKKGRITLSEQVPQGVRADFEKVESPGAVVPEITHLGFEMVEKSNVELNEEIPEMIMNRHSYSANLKTIQASGELLDSLLDIKA